MIVARRLIATVATLLILLVLATTPTRHQVVSAVVVEADCTAYRKNCLDAAGDYEHNCLMSGGSSSFCNAQWHWFYTTCATGAGCDPIIND